MIHPQGTLKDSKINVAAIIISNLLYEIMSVPMPNLSAMLSNVQKFTQDNLIDGIFQIALFKSFLFLIHWLMTGT